jgi:hypothetical protein
VSLRALEYFTYLLWTFFPVIHIAHRAGDVAPHAQYYLSIIYI